jgi:hypothetical protein
MKGICFLHDSKLFTEWGGGGCKQSVQELWRKCAFLCVLSAITRQFLLFFVSFFEFDDVFVYDSGLEST